MGEGGGNDKDRPDGGLLRLDRNKRLVLWQGIPGDIGCKLKVEAKFTTGTTISVPKREREALLGNDRNVVGAVAALFWCGQRNMASIIGAGIMDRYPNIRVGTLEAGHGWLPAWVNRLEEHTKLCPEALPLLKQTIREYVTGGRYFQSIEVSEGAAITQSVIDLLGSDILMFGSDYPHGESWFPVSVETVLNWKLKEGDLRKLLWDNAARYYRRYAA